MVRPDQKHKLHTESLILFSPLSPWFLHPVARSAAFLFLEPFFHGEREKGERKSAKTKRIAGSSSREEKVERSKDEVKTIYYAATAD